MFGIGTHETHNNVLSTGAKVNLGHFNIGGSINKQSTTVGQVNRKLVFFGSLASIDTRHGEVVVVRGQHTERGTTLDRHCIIGTNRFGESKQSTSFNSCRAFVRVVAC